MTHETVSRRTLAKGAAWAVPVVAIASAAPAFAASPEPPPPCPTLSGACGGYSYCSGNPAKSWMSLAISTTGNSSQTRQWVLDTGSGRFTLNDKYSPGIQSAWRWNIPNEAGCFTFTWQVTIPTANIDAFMSPSGNNDFTSTTAGTWNWYFPVTADNNGTNPAGNLSGGKHYTEPWTPIGAGMSTSYIKAVLCHNGRSGAAGNFSMCGGLDWHEALQGSTGLRRFPVYPGETAKFGLIHVSTRPRPTQDPMPGEPNTSGCIAAVGSVAVATFEHSLAMPKSNSGLRSSDAGWTAPQGNWNKNTTSPNNGFCKNGDGAMGGTNQTSFAEWLMP